MARTVACAEQVMITTIGAYFQTNKTVLELHELLKSGTGIDPLKDFAESACTEMRAITSS